LIHRLPKGRSQHIYLSGLGKETMDGLMPMQVVFAQPQASYKHIDLDRLKKLEKCGRPQLPNWQSFMNNRAVPA
jgi:hypothetical protein